MIEGRENYPVVLGGDGAGEEDGRWWMDKCLAILVILAVREI